MHSAFAVHELVDCHLGRDVFGVSICVRVAFFIDVVQLVRVDGVR